MVAADAANPWTAPQIPADIVIDTDTGSPEENAQIIREQLGLTSRAPHVPYPDP